MLRNSYHPLILTIIGLAIIGLGYKLIVSPSAFITQILMTIGIVTVLFFVVKRFVMPRINRNQSTFSPQQYKNAQKTAQKKANTTKTKSEKKRRISRPLVKRQSNVKLTVIEGKKNKKKNRALF